jgi:hypothetical protein
MESLDESVTGSTELVFPDDTDGETYRLRELNVYGAEEVRDDIGGDVPQYGSWLPVTVLETGEEAWLTAPSRLRKVLVENDLDTGERFTIVKMTKPGTDQSNPYRVQVTFPDRETEPADQQSLALD